MNGSSQFQAPRLAPVIIPLLAVLLVWGVLHVIGNVAARQDPPAACQIFGGHWGIWSGWSCG